MSEKPANTMPEVPLEDLFERAELKTEFSVCPHPTIDQPGFYAVTAQVDSGFTFTYGCPADVVRWMLECWLVETRATDTKTPLGHEAKRGK